MLIDSYEQIGMFIQSERSIYKALLLNICKRMNIDTMLIARILERFIFCCNKKFYFDSSLYKYSKVKLYILMDLIV